MRGARARCQGAGRSRLGKRLKPRGLETTRPDAAFVGRRIRLQVHNGHGSAMDQEGHLIEAGAVHASVKGRRREEERAAQGYDSTREASEAPAAAGAKVFQLPRG